jgi:hypothetical protein
MSRATDRTTYSPSENLPTARPQLDRGLVATLLVDVVLTVVMATCMVAIALLLLRPF